MSWALKRQILYILVLVIFFGAFGYMAISPIIKEMPTCADSKWNGDETGVDCGGSCVRACLYQVDQVSVLWTRVFKVVPGRYNAVAYLENHNKSSAVRKIRYSFRFADKDNLYIGKRDGEATIPASGRFAVFDPGIDFGNSVPVYSSFEFTETPVWVQVSEDKQKSINLSVSDVRLENESTEPRLSAKITNQSLFIIPDIDVVAILYDKDGNAISASSTYLERLGREETADLYFTWREPLPGAVVAKEIIPVYDIFRAEIE